MSAFEPISKIAGSLYRKNFPHRADELSYPQAKIAPSPPSTWSANKQLALLTVGRFLPFASDCIAHMRSRDVTFDQPHLAELRVNGLIYKQDITSRFHKLTPSGKRLAIETAEVVARQLGLHHIRETNRTTHRSNEVFTKSCTCGWRASSGVFTRGSKLSIDEQSAAHAADPEAWKRERSRPTPAVAAALARIDAIGLGKVLAFEQPDDVDAATEAYGDWPEINTPCSKAPAGQCEFTDTDPDHCMWCKRKT